MTSVDCRSNACDTTAGECTICDATNTCTEGYVCNSTICQAIQCSGENDDSPCAIEDKCDAATQQCVLQTGCTASTDCRSNLCNSTSGDCQECTVDGDNAAGDCPSEVEGDDDQYYVCDTTTNGCVATASDDGLSGGAVAAIVICSILGVMGITALIWYCVKKDAGTPDARAHDGHMSSSLIQ